MSQRRFLTTKIRSQKHNLSKQNEEFVSDFFAFKDTRPVWIKHALRHISFLCESNVKVSSIQIPKDVINLENAIPCSLRDTLKSLSCLLPLNKIHWNLLVFASIELSQN